MDIQQEQQVEPKMANLLNPYSSSTDPELRDKFATQIRSASFVDLYQLIRDNLKIDANKSHQFIKKLLMNEAYKQIARIRLHLFLLFYSIIIQLGWQRKKSKKQREYIESVLLSFDYFENDIFSLVSLCLKETYKDQKFSHEDICMLRLNILRLVSLQYYNQIKDKHRNDCFLLIKDIEDYQDHEISIFCGSKNIQTQQAMPLDYNNSQIELPQENISISLFIPIIIFLKLSLSLFFAGKKELNRLFTCLRCIKIDNVINILKVYIVAEETVKQTTKNQIQKHQSCDMQNSEGDLQYFIQYLLRQSRKDTNYIIRQNSNIEYYQTLKKDIRNQYHKTLIITKKFKKHIDEEFELRFPELYPIYLQYNNAINFMNSQNIYQKLHRNISQKRTNIFLYNFINRRTILFLNKQFTQTEVAFSEKQDDPCDELFSNEDNQGDNQGYILKLYEFPDVGQFMQQRMKQAQNLVAEELSFFKNYFKDHKLHDFLQISQKMLKSLLNNDLQASKSIFSLGKRRLSLINIKQQIQEISQDIIKKNMTSIRNYDLSSNQKNQDINIFVKVRTLIKHLEYDLQIKNKLIKIDQGWLNQTVLFLQKYQSSTQNNLFQLYLWTQIIKLKQLERLFIDIKSQVDFVNFRIVKGEERYYDFQEFSNVIEKLCEKELINRFLLNIYSFDIRSLLNRILNFIHVSSFKNARQKQDISKIIEIKQPKTARILPFKAKDHRKQKDSHKLSNEQQQQTLCFVNQSHDCNQGEQQQLKISFGLIMESSQQVLQYSSNQTQSYTRLTKIHQCNQNIWRID